MSNVLRRIEIPIALTIIFTLLQTIPYYFRWESDTKLVDPIEGAAGIVSQWVLLVVAWSIFIGVISLIQVHGKTVQKRSKGWYYSIIVLATCIIMTIAGLPFQEMGLGINNTVYTFLFNYVQSPLSATVFATIAFFITSAAYRSFRAKNIEATIVLVAGLLMLMSNAPLFTATLPVIKTMGQWIYDIPNMATNRAVTIGGALGLVALAVRTLLGRERGYLRGGGD
jgi:hypothetical protein